VAFASSGARGHGFGHCKAKGNGHSHQQPAGCSTDELSFAYEYDERGLVAEREVTSGGVVTRTS
jgi:hypothetical protein